MPLSIALMKPAKVSLAKILSKLDCEILSESSGGAIVFAWNGAHYSVHRDEFEPATYSAARRLDGTSASSSLKGSTDQIIVAVLDDVRDPGRRVAAGISLMLLGLSIGELAKAKFYLWMTSNNVARPVEMHQLTEAAVSSLAESAKGAEQSVDDLPLAFWASALAVEDGEEIAARSFGLVPFFDAEIELTYAREDAQTRISKLLRLITYVFDNGRVFSTGEKIQLSENEVLLASIVAGQDGKPPTCILQNTDNAE